MPDLVEDREAVVEEIVEHLVEQPAGALGEEALTKLGVLFAAPEQARDRQQLDVGQRDEVVGAEEEVELRRVQALDRLVVDREMDDAEEIVRVLVDLRPLPLREHVLDVERVPAEALRERVRGLRIGVVEMNPGQPARGELERVAFSERAVRDRAGAVPSPPDARQAGHRY